MSCIGTQINFTQARAGDTVRIDEVSFLVKQKCLSGRFLIVNSPDAGNIDVRVTEHDFNQAGAVLVEEAI